ncbi:MAG: uncharacterized protein KVP18_002268 [Porospora cf. gigantea A]|uniref:uncharacterized protein n=1 Tax=Porospora cf. gigantea A TaxID=2853593 RepID=UPI00355A6D00|nr:MAG: hypothetical protein KVP18_002268 [Porospora cf. gigantea A]
MRHSGLIAVAAATKRRDFIVNWDETCLASASVPLEDLYGVVNVFTGRQSKGLSLNGKQNHAIQELAKFSEVRGRRLSAWEPAEVESLSKQFAKKLEASRTPRGRYALKSVEAPDIHNNRDKVMGAALAGVSLLTNSHDLPEEIAPSYLKNLVVDVVPAANLQKLMRVLVDVLPCVRSAEVATEKRVYKSVRSVEGWDSANSPVDWNAIAGDFKDPLAPVQWFMGSKKQGELTNVGMNWVGAWQIMEGLQEPAPIDVAVVDSECAIGTDIDFRWTPSKDCDYNQVDSDGDGLVDNCQGWDFAENDNDTHGGSPHYHGTDVAGLIASRSNDNKGLTATCRHCRVHCLKIATDDGWMPISPMLAALDFLLENSDTFRISNHSYGGVEPSQVELDAITKLHQAGHVFITASGNEGCNIAEGSCTSYGFTVDGSYPAMYEVPNIISVGATDHTGRPAWFSNLGQGVSHVFAPGQEIAMASSEIGGETFNDGTSFSAPLVAAAVANAWSMFPHFPHNQLRQAVISAAPYDRIRSNEGNSGILDAAQLILSLQSSMTTTPSPIISTDLTPPPPMDTVTAIVAVTSSAYADFKETDSGDNLTPNGSPILLSGFSALFLALCFLC